MCTAENPRAVNPRVEEIDRPCQAHVSRCHEFFLRTGKAPHRRPRSAICRLSRCRVHMLHRGSPPLRSRAGHLHKLSARVVSFLSGAAQATAQAICTSPPRGSSPSSPEPRRRSAQALRAGHLLPIQSPIAAQTLPRGHLCRVPFLSGAAQPRKLLSLRSCTNHLCEPSAWVVFFLSDVARVLSEILCAEITFSVAPAAPILSPSLCCCSQRCGCRGEASRRWDDREAAGRERVEAFRRGCRRPSLHQRHVLRRAPRRCSCRRVRIPPAISCRREDSPHCRATRCATVARPSLQGPAFPSTSLTSHRERTHLCCCRDLFLCMGKTLHRHTCLYWPPLWLPNRPPRPPSAQRAVKALDVYNAVRNDVYNAVRNDVEQLHLRILLMAFGPRSWPSTGGHSR